MRCSSCGARCDPNRSFCPRCGSAVFLDDDTYRAERARVTEALGAGASMGSAMQPTQPQREVRQLKQPLRVSRPTVQAPTAAAGAGCVASLIRIALFAALAFYAYNALIRIPEVRDLVSAAKRGDPIDVTPLVNKVRSLFDLPPVTPGASRSSPATSAPGSTASPRSARPADARLYEVGQPGVSPPTAIERVPARYTPEALRAGIQGTVSLGCVVELDGTVSFAAVRRSLDQRYGLDNEALAAVRQWRFTPGTYNGRPARVATNVTITFTIRSREPARQ